MEQAEQVAATTEEAPKQEEQAQTDSGTILDTVAPETTESMKTSEASEATESAEAPEASWGDDWREKYANGDEAKLNVLKRYTTPQAALDALFDARTKISKGMAKGIDANSTPEEMDEWREANGIPKTPEDYNIDLGEGYVIGENDKPVVAEFTKLAHEYNLTPDQAAAFIKFKIDSEAVQDAKEMEAAIAIKEQNVNELKSEWGAETDTKLKHISNFLNTEFGENMKKLGTAVTEDGVALGNSTWFLKTMADLAYRFEPDTKSIATLDTNSNNSAIETEYDALVKRQKEDPTYSYDKKAQSRFQELVAMRIQKGLA
jgi:hypothetical protein